MILNEHPLPGAQNGVKETIQNLFELQRTLTPDAIAVKHGKNKLTYRELDIKSTTLAKQISAISPDRLYVGVSTSRNLDMIVSVLAILKSGKSYIPMDSNYPKERLMQMISDSQMDICLSPASETNIFNSLGLKSLPELSGENSLKQGIQVAGSLTYVLYTSGSTGKPKGVSMGQASMVNLLLWQKKNSTATIGTKTLQFAPLSFDVSFQEIFSTLITGGELVLINDDLRLDPNRLLEFIGTESIQRIFLPFVALQYLTEAADANGLLPDSLNEIITAGEQLKITRQLIRFFQGLPDCKLVNQYGPTECHVVSALVLTGPPESWPPLPSIGKPIDGCAIYILDEKQQPVKDGKSGELCIAGVCLAEGYLNRPELSREKFVQWVHPDKGPIRIYKTGDLAKYSADGNIEFLGRKDDQVKIRGYRVEPGEIEVLLSAQKGIQQAVVIAREDSPGQLRLVAYLISSTNEKDSLTLRNKLVERVPDYMIPSVFIWMDEFPKTSSGKIDRKSLPKPDNKRPGLSVLFKAPVTITEKRLATLWTELLQIDPIGINDHFFELGGNSLLAVKMVADLQLKHQLKLPVTKLYQYPTIAGVAGFLDGVNESPGTEIKSRSGERHEDIAVIAMAGRFP